MRLGVVVERSNYYKFLAPIVDEARGRGHSVTVLHREAGEGKGYLAPQAERSPFRGVPGVECARFGDAAELAEAIGRRGLEVCFGLGARARALPDGAGRPGCAWVTLQDGLDLFVNDAPEALATSELVCVYSDFWVEWARGYFAALDPSWREAFEARVLPRVAITGFPALDVLPRIDRAAVRARWGIPAGRPVVLLFPVTLGNQPGAWARVFARGSRAGQALEMLRRRRLGLWPWVCRGWNDRSLAAAIRRFCDRSGAFLLVKIREKDPLRSAIAAVADRVVRDESWHPASALEALSVASLCIHFYSTGALEAACAGCASLCLDRPSEDGRRFLSALNARWRHGGEGHAYHFPGVASFSTIPEAIAELPRRSLADFPLVPEARERYVRRFLGFGDGQSAARVLDAVARRLGVAA